MLIGFAKIYHVNPTTIFYLKLKITWIKGKNLLKATMKEEDHKIFDYVIVKMPEKLLKLEENPYQMGKILKTRVKITKVKNAVGSSGHLMDDYILSMNLENLKIKDFNLNNNFDDDIHVEEVDLEGGETIYDYKRREIKRMNIMAKKRDLYEKTEKRSSPYKFYIRQYE